MDQKWTFTYQLLIVFSLLNAGVQKRTNDLYDQSMINEMNEYILPKEITKQEHDGIPRSNDTKPELFDITNTNH